MNKIILFIILSLITLNAEAATRWVRTDGGVGTRCTGLADAADPGSGTDQACAVNHPNWVFPPTGNATPVSTARQANAGDTVVIKSGSYRMGQPTTSAPGVDATINITCGAGDSASCISGPIPDGVTVIGCSIGGCGCTNSARGVVTCTSTRPELWGAGNTRAVLNASNSTGVTIRDIEITDRENRGLDQTGELTAISAAKSCSPNDSPTKLSAQTGLLAHSATNLTLTNVNIHGVCSHGLFAANLTSPTLTGVNLNYNGAIGWDNDTTGTCTTCGYSGTITVTNSSINRNGCIEDWQNDGTIISGGCYTQGQGGYGDGIGLAATAGDFVITDSDFSHNFNDGADFLYHNKSPYSGGTLVFRRNRFEGNSGNPFKISNASIVEDNIILANCLYFLGASITLSGGSPLHCRGAGAAVSIQYTSSTVPQIYNNTIAGNGDTLIISSQCLAGSPGMLVRNNILIGGRDGQQDTSVGYSGGANDWVDLYYNDTGCSISPTFTNNYCVGMFKDTNECVATNTVVSVANQNNMNFTGSILQGGTTSNGSAGTGISAYATYATEPTDYAGNFYLQINSPAVDGANASYGDSVDFNNFSRTLPWDVGALEYGSVPTSGGGGGQSSATTHAQITGRGSISGGGSLP